MKTLLTIIMAAFILSGCVAKAPVTGRTQLMLTNESEMAKLGDEEAENILKSSKRADKATEDRVAAIGVKIVAAAKAAGYKGAEQKWEFYTLDDPTVNAFALPGGKVFFYTGILKLMKNDDQIACVMGHEIAHVLAQHGAERMSQQQIAAVGQEVLSAATKNSKYQSLYETAYGVGANVGVILPFSRKHESEADQIGVVLMTKAGYNPREAIVFWQAMAAASKAAGSKSPEFLSTHPSDERRIKDIEGYIAKGVK
ncbi:MAG: M48 family metallopeptidase [Helicobacteraceae bacterium]|jgi:predicted Zn-dependent protease|nr:M48 family metallopeptidase [Helicobacteraceae bacterium]